MKNVTTILLMIILAFMSIGLRAQNYGYHYSGYSHRGNVHMPHGVIRVVNLYPEFAWVGTTQVQRGHRLLYIVTLQRRNRFLELTINQRGDIISRNRYVRTYHVTSYPYTGVYTGNKVSYHNNGYVYSRWEDRQHLDYPWQNGWKNGKNWDKKDKDHKDNKNDRSDWNSPGRRNR